MILGCLFFLIPLCSLPPTRLGYYNQVESPLLAFWLFSAFSGIWIYFLWKKNPRLAYQTSQLPLVWGPLLLGVATILISPFHALPLRDFTGSPHIGEGGLTFIAMGMMAGHFSILTRIAFYRKIIFTTAFLAGLLISALTIAGSMESPFINWRYGSWAPFSFPDFLAFIDIGLITIYLYERKDLKDRRLFRDSVAICCFTLITYYASNKSLGYGMVIAAASTLAIWFFPASWRRSLLHISFFGLSLFITLLIMFYDDFSHALPESLKSLGHIQTLLSRTWLSKVTLIDLWHAPLSWDWVHQLLIGKGWGTFNNTATANMFLIDQVSLFSGKDYNPSWELVNRDLLHTHNILTSFLHSFGLMGVGLYLYTQYKLVSSLSPHHFLLGSIFLICYQVQVLFWFQFILTVPFSLLAFSLFFRQRSQTPWAFLFKPKWMLGFCAGLLLFAGLQGVITLGYEGLKNQKESTANLVTELTLAPYVRLEAAFGAQRQVALARIYATAMQEELEKSPQMLVTKSLQLVNHLKYLQKEGNYLANNLAINILSELASNPETLTLLTAQTFQTWEQLTKDHMTLMPYRSDILLPFFNLYQTLGKEAFVLDVTRGITEHNLHDAIALWFMGSSLLKNPSHFDKAMCILQKSVREGVERFMPVPPLLKAKIMTYAKVCPPYNELINELRLQNRLS